MESCEAETGASETTCDPINFTSLSAGNSCSTYVTFD